MTGRESLNAAFLTGGLWLLVLLERRASAFKENASEAWEVKCQKDIESSWAVQKSVWNTG